MSHEAEEQLRKELSEARQRISELEEALYQRNRVEDAVRGSEDRYRKFMENAHDVLWVFDLNLGYTYVSPSVKLLRGYTVEEVMKQKLDDVLTPGSAKKARELFEREKLLELGGRHHAPEWSYTTDFEMIHKDGRTFWAEMTMNPFYDGEGGIKGILGITRDISDRKRAEEELKKHRDHLEELVRERTAELSQLIVLLENEIADRREAEEKLRRSEERYRIYFSLSNDVMFSYDNQFRVQSVSPNMEKILGFKPEELVGKTFLEAGVLDPDCMNEAINNALKVLSGETVYDSVYQFITKDGEKKYGEVSGVPLMRDGTVEGEITVARDITEWVSMRKSLQESEERYRTTLQTLPDAVSIMSADELGYLYVNDAFCALTGYDLEEVLGKTPFELDLSASPDDLARCADILRRGEPVSNRPHLCRTRSGALLDTIISARPIIYGGEPCVVMILTDVTALRQIEGDKRRIDLKAQKMEAIGTLAAGIAHDFNNLLTTIIGYAKMSMKDFMLIKKEDKDLSTVRGDLDEVSHAAYRARDLVNHILAFSRHAEKDYSPIELSAAVRDSLKLLRSTLPSNITLMEDIEDSQLILGDRAQMHIVLTNLCTNAAHAMEGKGGVVEVGLHPVMADDALPDADMPDGPYVKLTVRDTGQGMPPHIMAKAFDPYFTTKAKGQGVGLGLSVVHGIVKSHGGAVHCRSLPGRGTTFDIFLPRYEHGVDGLEIRYEVLSDDRAGRILDLDQDLPPGEMGGKKAYEKGVQGKEKKL